MPTPVRLQQNPINDRQQRSQSKLCAECKKHKAIFFRATKKRKVRRRKDHDLCLRCYRALLNRLRPNK